MSAHSLSFRPRCEEMEEKNAPTVVCTIDPPHGPAATVSINVADEGCINGLTNAMAATGATPAAGVITCPKMPG